MLTLAVALNHSTLVEYFDAKSSLNIYPGFLFTSITRREVRL